MLKSLLRNLTIGVAVSVTALPSSASEIDTRLVGNWQGQREQGGKCTFLAWKMARYADGKFEIAFFKDPHRTKESSRERGVWWVKGNEFYTHTKGVAAPDGYRYKVLSENTVRFTVLKRDPSGDCQAAYEFTDHRVPTK